MARVVYVPAAVRDFERLVDFLLEDDPSAALDTADLLTGAIAMLEKHPLVGRVTTEGMRELVISRGQSGYIALYDYQAAADLVVVLGVRHQREAGYWDLSD